MVVKCCQGPGFNSLATDTFVLNWKTLPFPPSRNGLPFNATTPGNKFHSTNFQSIKFQGTHTHILNCILNSLIEFDDVALSCNESMIRAKVGINGFHDY